MLPPMPQEYVELRKQLTELLEKRYVEFFPNKDKDFDNEIPYIHLFRVVDILISDKEVYELVNKIKEHEKERIGKISLGIMKEALNNNESKTLEKDERIFLPSEQL